MASAEDSSSANSLMSEKSTADGDFCSSNISSSPLDSYLEQTIHFIITFYIKIRRKERICAFTYFHSYGFSELHKFHKTKTLAHVMFSVPGQMAS